MCDAFHVSKSDVNNMPVKAPAELVLRPSAVEQEFRRRLEQYQGDSEEVCRTGN